MGIKWSQMVPNLWSLCLIVYNSLDRVGCPSVFQSFPFCNLGPSFLAKLHPTWTKSNLLALVFFNKTFLSKDFIFQYKSIVCKYWFFLLLVLLVFKINAITSIEISMSEMKPLLQIIHVFLHQFHNEWKVEFALENGEPNIFLKAGSRTSPCLIIRYSTTTMSTLTCHNCDMCLIMTL